MRIIRHGVWILLLVMWAGKCFVLAEDESDIQPLNISGGLVVFNSDGSKSIKGNLKLVKGTMIITADEGQYWEEQQQAFAYGNVKVIDKDRTLVCGALRADLDLHKNVATINPRLTSCERENGELKSKVILRANVIEIYEKLNKIRGISNVFLIQYNYSTSGKKKITKKEQISKLSCDRIEIFLDEKRIIAYGNVVIINVDMLAKGDKAEIYEKEQKLVLSGNAQAYQKRRKELVFVRNKNIFAEAEKLIYWGKEDKIHLIGRASSWRKGDANIIKGEKIIYYAKENRSIVLKAKAEIYPEEKKEKETVREKKEKLKKGKKKIAEEKAFKELKEGD